MTHRHTRTFCTQHPRVHQPSEMQLPLHPSAIPVDGLCAEPCTAVTPDAVAGLPAMLHLPCEMGDLLRKRLKHRVNIRDITISHNIKGHIRSYFSFSASALKHSLQHFRGFSVAVPVVKTLTRTTEQFEECSKRWALKDFSLGRALKDFSCSKHLQTSYTS
jgi:hypothetical protein